MTTIDFIIELFYRADNELGEAKHPRGATSGMHLYHIAANY